MAARKIHLFLDWDGTLTDADTLAVVASVGYNKHATLSGSGSPSKPLPPFSYFTDAYLADVQEHTSSYRPAASERTTLAQELEWMESLAGCEERSVQRVEEAGIFKGVSRTDVRMAARHAIGDRQIQLRRGWARLIKGVLDGDGSVTVISVNWSGEFIRWCLTAAEETGGRASEGLGNSLIARVDVIANEISDDASGKLTRSVDGKSRGIWTGEDKRKMMMEQIRGRAENEKVLYVGDSVSDLACLTAETVTGICITTQRKTGEQRKLADTLERMCMGVKRIEQPGTLGEAERDASGAPGWIYGAEDLDEARQVVSGHAWCSSGSCQNADALEREDLLLVSRARGDEWIPEVA